MYFGFNIWYAVVTYVHCVTIEQFNKFIMWGAMLSYKIQKRISDFCFDINSKWRVKPNSILFSILFVVFNVFVYRVIICRQPSFSRDFWYISFDLLNMVSLDDQVKIIFSTDVENFLRTIGERFESFLIFIINFAIRFVVWLIIQIIQIE